MSDVAGRCLASVPFGALQGLVQAAMTVAAQGHDRIGHDRMTAHLADDGLIKLASIRSAAGILEPFSLERRIDGPLDING